MQIPDVARESLLSRIYDINENSFEGVAMEVWKYQYRYNPLYQSYCQLLGIKDIDVKSLTQIPFLPISLFKEHEIKTGSWDSDTLFRSSGTTGIIPSQHHVRNLAWYHSIALKCFSSFLGDPGQYVWIGLLPSYLERSDSSLVDMVHYFMQCGNHAENIFYPEVSGKIISLLTSLQKKNQLTILMGVSFALLDLFEKYEVPLWEKLIIIETGGMKGRGKEITREELYDRLRMQDNGLRIVSEYGMTELMSQSYSTHQHFYPGPTMRVSIRDISDPFENNKMNQRGVINIIDLANIDTCAFIATDDIGIGYADGSFDVLGRLDNSDLRGCNLMYS